MIFVDTPGLTSPRDLLGKRLVKHSEEALVDCDVCLFMVSGIHPEPKDEDRWAFRVLRGGLRNRKPAPTLYLVINKVDRVPDKRELLPVIENYSKLGEFSEVFPISALKGDNLKTLEKAIEACLPVGPAYFQEEDLESGEDLFYISEIIREKVLMFIHEEVPHGVAVAIDEVRPGKDGKTLYVRATIFVERESHKAIVVGAGGQMLKKIGSKARKELSLWKKQPVFLDLWVKVKEGWQDREEMLRLFGYA